MRPGGHLCVADEILARLWQLPFHQRRLLKQLSQRPGRWCARPRSFSDLGVLNHQIMLGMQAECNLVADTVCGIYGHCESSQAGRAP